MVSFISVLGRLGKEPITRAIQPRNSNNRTNVTNLRVASNDYVGGKQQTTWYDVEVWGDRFSNKIGHMHRGSAVFIAGTFASSIWTDRNNEQRISNKVIATNVEFGIDPPAQQEHSRDTVDGVANIDNNYYQRPRHQTPHASNVAGGSLMSSSNDYRTTNIGAEGTSSSTPNRRKAVTRTAQNYGTANDGFDSINSSGSSKRRKLGIIHNNTMPTEPNDQTETGRQSARNSPSRIQSDHGIPNHRMLALLNRENTPERNESATSSETGVPQRRRRRQELPSPYARRSPTHGSSTATAYSTESDDNEPRINVSGQRNESDNVSTSSDDFDIRRKGKLPEMAEETIENDLSYESADDSAGSLGEFIVHDGPNKSQPPYRKSPFVDDEASTSSKPASELRPRRKQRVWQMSELNDKLISTYGMADVVTKGRFTTNHVGWLDTCVCADKTDDINRKNWLMKLKNALEKAP